MAMLLLFSLVAELKKILFQRALFKLEVILCLSNVCHPK